VQSCIEAKKRIEELTLEELKRFSPEFDKDIYEFIAPQAVVDRRRALGGTARRNVERRLRELRL
jgi:argininosuccinate lyase